MEALVPSNIEVVDSYLNLLKSHDLTKAPFADDIVYESPTLDTPIRGRQHVIRHMQAYLPAMHDVKVVRHISEDDHVATLWKFYSAFGLSHLFQFVCIRDGLITDLRFFWDPRPFLEALGEASDR